MWIKLHDYVYGREIAVQTQNICVIYPFADNKGCIVSFFGAEENYIQVKETIDEIGAMITRYMEHTNDGRVN